MRLWTAVLAALQIIAGGSVLLEFVETRWVGLFSLVIAAMQAGTVLYMKSPDEPRGQYRPAHGLPEEL